MMINNNQSTTEGYNTSNTFLFDSLQQNKIKQTSKEVNNLPQTDNRHINALKDLSFDIDLFLSQMR